MRIPGFTAEISLYKTRKNYRISRNDGKLINGHGVIPQYTCENPYGHGAPQEFMHAQCCCGPGKICAPYPNGRDGACGFDKHGPIYCRGQCVPY